MFAVLANPRTAVAIAVAARPLEKEEEEEGGGGSAFPALRLFPDCSFISRDHRPGFTEEEEEEGAAAAAEGFPDNAIAPEVRELRRELR